MEHRFCTYALGGLLASTSELTAAAGDNLHSEGSPAPDYVGPSASPCVLMIAKDVTNQLMAGRNVSATHVGLGLSAGCRRLQR